MRSIIQNAAIKLSGRLFTPQRMIFDLLVVPELTRNKSRILFIGIDWYCQHLFDNRYTTIDPNPNKAKYGQNTNHIIGTVQDSFLEVKHRSGNRGWDVIFMNGVYGYGLDDRDTLETTLNELCKMLEDDGVLLFGFDNSENRNPLKLKSIGDIKGVVAKRIDWLDNQAQLIIPTKKRHTFWFFGKSY